MMRNGEKKSATIYDIAQMTGFTAATVSKVLNNKDKISEKTRDKVLEASKELNYFPNPAARSLKTQRTNQVMISIPHMNNAFYFDMIAAIHEVANENNYSLILNYTQESEKEELKMLRNVRENFVDGLILISINFTEKHLNEIKRINQPVVFSSIGVNRIKDDEGLFDFVGVDTRKGIYLAAEHLIKQGHTRIGYVGLPLGTQTGNERYEGFCQAMKQWGLDINHEYVINGGYSRNFGYDAGIKLFNNGDVPTAICTTSDLIALGLYQAFEEKGIKIPEDVAIVGMDNIDVTTVVRPKLSTVAIASAEIGRTAAELIFKRLNGSDEQHKNIIFQPRLVVRESSKTLL